MTFPWRSRGFLRAWGQAKSRSLNTLSERIEGEGPLLEETPPYKKDTSSLMNASLLWMVAKSVRT